MTREQISERPTTLRQIMSKRSFERGVDDVRAGRPFPLDYDSWRDTNDQWSYERGRQWATLVPRDVSVRAYGKINPKALQWFSRYRDVIV